MIRAAGRAAKFASGLAVRMAMAMSAVAIGPLACGGVGAEEAIRAQRRYELAVGFAREGNQPEAFRQLEQAIALNGRNADARLLRANLYLARGNLEAAEREAREALLARERFADARNSLGVILIHRRRFDEAIRELRIAADDVLYREPHLAWGNLGWAYLEKGATEQALSALRHAVAIEPRFCVGHYRMGDLHYRSGRFAAAVESLERAIGVTDPACERLQDAHRLLGVSLMRTDRREDAAAAFRRCRDLGSEAPAGRECVRFLGMLQ